MKRTAFFISDGTGITAEALGNSLLAQFGSISFNKVTLPYVDNAEKANEAVRVIDKAGNDDGHRPLVFDTIVDEATRAIIATSSAYKIDVFSAFLKPLELELGSHSSYSVGKSHSINEVNTYMDRIESVNFAMENDDGAKTRHYDKADIILTGVSRCGKTPSCLYMALQFGIRAANYPLTDSDINSTELPEVLEPYRDKLFGLTIDPFQLAAIRHERRANSQYASLDQCEDEVQSVERMLRQQNIPYINTTHFSIEEIATRIIAQKGLQRRIK
ncbi:pyruvate, water dikinase regulatory protein [Amphritea sp. 1_MG-2023]|uniref:posphoenolpyruvate synthetase regulatory kinase/phosphorylase PpsR n=1 Tax=Amphritea sp. 1_MG-2023 TaxID=3062670 RepID=UPI0026E2F7BE|nr:pyruvate, water dikinase regulatory protein [Amphritea sp. 1_MG-2023]MDO6563163.1 pyruvate, water dikinase regulatory protein [Amphritea sp. 1_MG-2023]